MPLPANSYDVNLLSEENVKINILPYYNLENSKVTAIKFKDTDKQRAVYKITSSNGDFCLKKVYFDKDELLFVYSAIEWLYRNNIYVPRILPNKDKGRFVEYEDMLFILTPWIDGPKCNYSSKNQTLYSYKNLANMHFLSKGFFPVSGSTYRKGCNNLFLSINKHFENLLINSNLAFKEKDMFSKIYLNYFEKALYLANASLASLNLTDFDKLSISLCHMDYVSKNLIYDKNDNLWTIDFDKCRIDYCIYDLSYSLRRVLRRERSSWNIDILLECLKAYEEIKPLNVNEYSYLLGYLAFPQKYWKISRDYYKNINKCNKKSFINILSKSLRDIDDQIKFVDSFNQYINNKFSIK
ncbi:spore coat protein I [Clostridium homopropionicum DSM 5847]|uniref:Spore coat protein I n=1 Tax=Clostridium homopropionicum DSM 5847 TaxID=1121318 RepID=A0A0L6ZE34_9CLOT|nr:CotS family spore coat protein [Clostridium homopropionicum]KOA21225.1 spore coat protein I [Clostridium homopropionicum DSM 5847]SFG27918.1 spore coat protein, CotS family [Clostridium homopropionicum]